jgi:hypothetical protein
MYDSQSFERKLSYRLWKMLSYGDRLCYNNFVLTSWPIFLLCLFEIPNSLRKRLDQYRSLFSFGKLINIKKKYHLTKWNIISRPRDPGGLGIEVLEIKKIGVYSTNGCLHYLMKKECGMSCCIKSTYNKKKHYQCTR